jgi:filamentous hemagglutinin family protein
MRNGTITFLTVLAALELVGSCRLQAQTIPDNSLNEEASQMKLGTVGNNVVEVVGGGARRNSSLFHSFQQLNVAPSRGLYFEDPGVRSIFARVTGTNPSIIAGTLGVLGNADLFLLNPNGIIFSESARLDLRGSFLATTANSVNFNEFQFTAENPQTIPLLTINTPIGLGFLQNSSAITVQGTGHSLQYKGARAFAPDNPFDRSGLGTSGLQVAAGESLSLIGGRIHFNGGIAVAESGNLEIAAIRSGIVGLSQETGSLEFNYDNTSFQDIRLQRLSLLDASGIGGSTISLAGRNIILRDGSYALVQNQGSQEDNQIRVIADRLVIQGNRLNSSIPLTVRNPLINAGILSNTTQDGSGASINIAANRIEVENAGSIRSASFGTGVAGDIYILARQIVIQGDPVSAASFNLSNIQSVSVGSGGNTGNVSIDAQQLFIGSGGIVSTNTDNPVASRVGGTLSVQSDSITVTGQSQFFPFPSSLTTASTNASQAGEVLIESKSLLVSNGAIVGSLAFSAGRSGNVLVDAETITVEGSFKPSSLRPASLSISRFENPSFARDVTSSALQSAYNPPLSSNPFGTSTEVREQGGNLTLNTQTLNVRDAGFVLLLDKGAGEIGNLSINANQINLHRGGIVAVTLNSDGGNISISSQNLNLDSGSLVSASARGRSDGGSINIQSNFLLLDDGSIVSTNNEQTTPSEKLSGNGGNIFINTDFTNLAQESQINANADQGSGGRVQIEAAQVFASIDSAITATSSRGPEFDGTVEIRTSLNDPTPDSLLTPLTPPPQVVSACPGQADEGESQFVISGAGGLPDNPSNIRQPRRGWVDSTQTTSPDPAVRPTPSSNLVEAQTWVRTSNGTVQLIAEENNSGGASFAQNLSCP